MTDVRKALQQFMESIGDEGNKAEADKERNKVRRMLTALGQESQPSNQNDAPETNGNAQTATQVGRFTLTSQNCSKNLAAKTILAWNGFMHVL